MQRCLNEVISKLGGMSEIEMQEQIAIRMTKTIQDSPPHYAIQDRALIRLALAGLIEFVRSDQRDGWRHIPAPNMVIRNEISRDQLTEDCNSAVEITETPPLIII
jgi:hypothetical protein